MSSSKRNTLLTLTSVAVVCLALDAQAQDVFGTGDDLASVHVVIINNADEARVDAVLVDHDQPVIWPNRDGSAWCDEGILEWMLCQQIGLYLQGPEDDGLEALITTPGNALLGEELSSQGIEFGVIDVDTPTPPAPLEQVKCPDGGDPHTFTNGVTCCCSMTWSQLPNGRWICGDGINSTVTVLKND